MPTRKPPSSPNSKRKASSLTSWPRKSATAAPHSTPSTSSATSPGARSHSRAEQVKKRDYFTRYSGTARKVLELLLDKYADTGIGEIESLDVLKLKPFDTLGSVPQIIKEFGGKPQYLAAIRDLERTLYQ